MDIPPNDNPQPMGPDTLPSAMVKQFQEFLERNKPGEDDIYDESIRYLMDLKIKKMREEMEKRKAAEPKERIVYVPYPVYIQPAPPVYVYPYFHDPIRDGYTWCSNTPFVNPFEVSC